MKKSCIVAIAALASVCASAADVKKPSIEPRWKGAAVAEWTMDYATALKQAKAEGKWSLMLYTGSWWCPWCQPLEAKVFDTAAWKTYAADCGFYEIELDYPKRDGTGYNCWLWDADFLAKNGLTAVKATAALKDLYAQQDKYALPGANKQTCTNGTAKVTYKRIGYPTVLVLRPDGTVAGRFGPSVRDGENFDGSKAEGKVWTEDEAFAAVKSAVEEIIANAETHVTAAVSEDCDGKGTVGALDTTVHTGTAVPLKATPAKGMLFAGWYNGGAPAETVSDYRTAANSFVAQGGDVTLEARFVEAADDFIFFDFSTVLSSLEVGEAVDEALEVDSETFPTVKFTGLPAGLKFDAKSLRLSGAASKEGVYYVMAYAKNASGREYTQVVKCTVGEPEEPAPSALAELVDLEGFDPLEIGVPFETVLGVYSADAKIGITSVSGLPPGLSVVKETEDGVTVYSVAGTPLKGGLYTLKVSGSAWDDEKGKVVNGSISAYAIVESFPSVYISAVAGEGGTVTGAGVYAAGATAALKAKAGKGFVFAGWFDGENGDPLSAGGADFRNPDMKFPVIDESGLFWYASFAPAADDAEIAISSDGFAEGDTVEFDESELYGEPFKLAFGVDSVSLPAAKVAGLPAGFEVSSLPGGGYAICYDPASAKKRPVPDVYEVKITASNVSKASCTSSFKIKVANWTSEALAIEDVYPDAAGFTPGAEIDPIDFSGVFDEGVLSVSGLPKGLSFNAKANPAKGIEANSVTGKPTVPGEYTATFTLKNGKETSVATATFVVAPFPETAVAVSGGGDGDDAEAAGCKVTGAGGYMAGSKVTLKANAAKGWVFAGWDGPEGSDIALLNPTLTIVSGETDVEYAANFLRVSEDWLEILEYDSGDEADEARDVLKLALNSEVKDTPAAGAIANLVDSGSMPSVTATGLPAGLKFDAKTLLLSGKPSKSGVYYATVSAKNAGGYTHSRVLRVEVLSAGGERPAEVPEDDGGIDFSALDFLATGEAAEAEIEIPAFDDGDVFRAVKSATVAGLPKGLAGKVALDGFGSAYLAVSGVPVAAGRFTVKLSVVYEGNRKLAAQHTVTVEDSGAGYLFVRTLDAAGGTVSGEGVYAAGATVKLSAKAAQKNVFAGWWDGDAAVDAETSAVTGEPFAVAGTDWRAPSLSFAMSPARFGATVAGAFVPSASDGSVAFDAADDEWTIDPEESSSFAFAVGSLSLPTVKATGLPKGVVLSKDGAALVYDAADRSKLVPGEYDVALDAQNVSKAKAATMHVTVRIPVPANDFLADFGLDQEAGYTVRAGVAAGGMLDDLADFCNALDAAGLAVSFKNLPAGITVKKVDGAYAVSGVPSKSGCSTVTVTAKGSVDGESVNEAGMFFLRALALPEGATGTFNGTVYTGDAYDMDNDPPRSVDTGSFTVSATAAGKISAKVVRPTGTYSFSANSWDAIVPADGEGSEAYATVAMADAKGNGLDIQVYFERCSGELHVEGLFIESGKEAVYGVTAQRDAFAAKDAEALAVAEALKGTWVFAERSETETFSGKVYSYSLDPAAPPAARKLTVTVDAKGAAKFAGKCGAKSVNGSAVLTLGSNGAGAPVAVAKLVVKFDGESVAIAVVEFVYDEGEGAWKMSDPDGGDAPGATIEIYKSDCGECSI